MGILASIKLQKVLLEYIEKNSKPACCVNGVEGDFLAKVALALRLKMDNQQNIGRIIVPVEQWSHKAPTGNMSFLRTSWYLLLMEHSKDDYNMYRSSLLCLKSQSYCSLLSSNLV